MLTRIFILVAIGALCGGLPFLLAGYEDEASKIPPQWDLDYRGRSIGQIVHQLGAPQDRAEAKQFMNWVLPDRDGVRVLKVICAQDCSDGEYPADVLYLFFRVDGQGPVRSKDLLKAQSALKARRPPRAWAPASAGR